MMDPDDNSAKGGKHGEETNDDHRTIYGGHPIPDVPEVDGDDDLIEDKFEEPIASPNVTGEQDVFSGDTPQGEPADIDAELEKLGLPGDTDKGPRTLDVSKDLD